MSNDDTIIITNLADTDSGATETATQNAATETAAAQPAEEPKTFREAAREQIHEEENIPAQSLSILKILGGDFFTSQILRRQIWLIILISLFVMLYISNRYSYQKSMLEIDRLRTELQDMKYKALSTSSKLTEKSRQSRVLEMLKNNKDSVLKIADQPPYIIEVKE